MKVFHKILDFNQEVNSDIVVTIGNFDGVHLGHQDLIQQIKKNYPDLKLVVITFSPHPIFILNKDCKHYLLQSNQDKLQELENSGVDYVIQMNFTEELRSMDAATFTHQILLELNGIKAISLGHDFSIGNNGEESKEIVSKIFTEKSLSVFQCISYKYKDQLVSSSIIRKQLALGNIQNVSAYLGRDYKIAGKVVHGKKIGRDIGFPTANIEVSQLQFIPKFGVYKVRVSVLGKLEHGMLNIGHNPTVSDEDNLKVECHILDFNKDIYGQDIKIFFEYFIRDELKFNNLNDLKAQIAKDIENCRLRL